MHKNQNFRKRFFVEKYFMPKMFCSTGAYNRSKLARYNIETESRGKPNGIIVAIARRNI